MSLHALVTCRKSKWRDKSRSWRITSRFFICILVYIFFLHLQSMMIFADAATNHKCSIMKPVQQNFHKRNFILQETPFKIHLCKMRANNRKKAFPGRKTLYPEAECTCIITSKESARIFFFLLQNIILFHFKGILSLSVAGIATP